MDIENSQDIWKRTRSFILKDRGYDIIIVRYNLTPNIHGNCILILIIEDNYYVITDKVHTVLTSEEIKKVTIALNCELPYSEKDDDKNNRLEFTRFDNKMLPSHPIAQKIINIIHEINPNIKQ